ncbi:MULTISPECIES: LCP family protein [unclassified Oscillibacter]|uniref:LCP family protein n=1 Tax=unclassified Oscillibacter TaxID=2629304 RepID=UPI0025D49A75|nr:MULTISPECIES: LCP family protein [unclassified Oscillibacter]
MVKKRRRRRISPLQRRLLGLVVILSVFVGLTLTYKAIVRPPQLEDENGAGLPASSQALSSAELALQDADQLALAAKAAHSARKPDFYTILVSGVDDGNGGSDTNILVAVDAGAGRIYGVNIPRDTKSRINGKNYKFNAAYNIGGMEQAAETLSCQLGIPVDYTVEVSLKAFSALVDAIGGVDFNIPVDMDYDDPIQNLSIHFSAGTRHLTGAEALKVVRFRHNNDGTGYGSEDIGRMKTQQDFLKTVAKQTLRPANLTKVSQFAKIFQQYVKTDLELGELAWLGQEAFSMGADNVDFSTLPGEWHSPYIYLKADEVLLIVNEYLNPYVEDRVLADLNILS